MGTSTFADTLKRKIEREYRARGYTLGWRLLLSPEAVLDGARVALISLNPGGDRKPPDHAEFAMPHGSAYERETWRSRNLQRQIRSLFTRLGEPAEKVLAGYLVPFRSPSWQSLRDKESALHFGRDLWRDILMQSKPNVAIAIGRETIGAVKSVLAVRDVVRIPVKWGELAGERGTFPGGDFVGLPHLSRFQIIDRPESEQALKKLLLGL